MGNYDHEPLSDDFQTENVEISDLPPMEEGQPAYTPGISSAFAKLGTRLPKRRRTWRVVMGIATISLLIGLLLSNVSILRTNVLGLFPTPTSTPTTLQNGPFLIINTTPKPDFNRWDANGTAIPSGKGRRVQTMAAAAPQNCALVPKVGGGGEVGQAPVWFYGFDGPHATIHLHGFSEPVAHNIYGWPILIQLMVAKDFTQPVTLSGGNLGSGPSIFFAFYPGERPMDSLILGTQQSVGNPIQPEPGQKATWVFTMFFFGAGCYYLTVSWPGGSWTIHFAAGG